MWRKYAESPVSGSCTKTNTCLQKYSDAFTPDALVIISRLICRCSTALGPGASRLPLADKPCRGCLLEENKPFQNLRDVSGSGFFSTLISFFCSSANTILPWRRSSNPSTMAHTSSPSSSSSSTSRSHRRPSEPYLSSLIRWLQLKKYQYEVTFSLYMLTSTEKFIFSTTPFLQPPPSSCLFLPTYLLMRVDFLK